MAVGKGSTAGFQGAVTIGVIFAMIKQGRLTVNRLHLIFEEVASESITNAGELEKRIRDEIDPPRG